MMNIHKELPLSFPGWSTLPGPLTPFYTNIATLPFVGIKAVTYFALKTNFSEADPKIVGLDMFGRTCAINKRYFGMHNVLITVAVGLALNLPGKVLGQDTALAVQSGDLIELRVGGAVRNAGLFTVDPIATLSEVLAMAGGPTARGQGDKVWVFRDGEIITTILGGRGGSRTPLSDRVIDSSSPG